MSEKVQIYRLALKRAGTLRIAETHARDANHVQRIAHAMLKDEPFENFIAIYLDNGHRVLGVVRIATTGSVSTCNIDPKAVLKAALLANATCIVLAHNHPSGNSQPSEDDIKTTTTMLEVTKLVGLSLLDHVIVTKEGSSFSFQMNGLLS